MNRRKRFFAQMNDCNPSIHKAKCFTNKDEAIKWLKEVGDGVVKHKTKRFGYLDNCYVKNGMVFKAKSAEEQFREIAKELGISCNEYMLPFTK